MLFSVEPKESLKDLFNREEEVKKFLQCVNNERMIIVTGLRRVGKSSLVLAGLNSLNRGYILVDLRKIFDNVSKRITPDKLYEEIHFNLTKINKIYLDGG
ncbi:ATP-binding protein [Saccharolobus solfataricus]|uniref:ATP-binding protein n=2 Tax=Saccharolobus solfataricus TaxID=2287 RepID=Q97XN4_SACS2|nr:ATP-binding protein [Saccharolobus solfataricus]AAK41889.1 Conserved hypothetical protein [Saccharolobus solfataricus P2]AKA74622.1 ATP-binding protein [Saccharolobus solfataricus]AKA77318.1 ATP-binding protein [Saccharolobus solfataricus]AKA80009.1 ATP-binding protein [Saccharolobus solfataricus]AZF69091.1 ATP-binding protein [Saccharolobus solfataricus]